MSQRAPASPSEPEQRQRPEGDWQAAELSPSRPRRARWPAVSVSSQNGGSSVARGLPTAHWPMANGLFTAHAASPSRSQFSALPLRCLCDNARLTQACTAPRPPAVCQQQQASMTCRPSVPLTAHQHSRQLRRASTLPTPIRVADCLLLITRLALEPTAPLSQSSVMRRSLRRPYPRCPATACSAALSLRSVVDRGCTPECPSSALHHPEFQVREVHSEHGRCNAESPCPHCSAPFRCRRCHSF